MENSDLASEGIFAVLGAFVFVYLVILVLMVVSFWKIFEKAGKPGWAAIVPIYNLIVFLEIVNKPVWWLVLILIPIVNIVILIMLTLTHRLSLSFGQGVGFTILLIFVGIIGYPVLAFGDYKYVGPLKD